MNSSKDFRRGLCRRGWIFGISDRVLRVCLGFYGLSSFFSGEGYLLGIYSDLGGALADFVGLGNWGFYGFVGDCLRPSLMFIGLAKFNLSLIISDIKKLMISLDYSPLFPFYGDLAGSIVGEGFY